MTGPDVTSLPDLASRLLGGRVVAANDELFAEKENLVKPGAPVFAADEYGNQGKVYDGWETARRREAGHDHAIVRLGVPGIVHGVVVDTAFFRGNYPPQISVEAVGAEGYPSPDELAGLDWQTLVPRAAAQGDTANVYPVADRRRWTHVRLSIYPDGGVARFRVHGDRAARSAVPGRHRRPGGDGERRPGGRLLGRVLRVGVEPDPARPRAQHGRGLGERAAPRTRPRLRDPGLGRARACCIMSRSIPRASWATPLAGPGWPPRMRVACRPVAAWRFRPAFPALFPILPCPFRTRYGGRCCR